MKTKGKASKEGKIYGQAIGGAVGKEVGKKVGTELAGKPGGAVGGAIGGIAGKEGGKIAGRYGGWAVGKAIHKARTDGIPIAKSAAAGVKEVGKNYVKALGSFKKGGKVHKTGHYLLHKGEFVVPNLKKGSKRHLIVVR